MKDERSSFMEPWEEKEIYKKSKNVRNFSSSLQSNTEGTCRRCDYQERVPMLR